MRPSKVKFITIVSELLCLGLVVTLICYFALTLGRDKPISHEVFSASFTQFELRNNNTALRYNLTINALLANPNFIGSYSFDQVQAVAVFANIPLLYSEWPSFRIPHKEKASLTLSNGMVPAMVSAGANDLSKFQNSRVFDILYMVHAKGSTKLWGREKQFDHWFYCNLKVPLSNSDGKSDQPFTSTRCQKADPAMVQEERDAMTKYKKPTRRLQHNIRKLHM